MLAQQVLLPLHGGMTLILVLNGMQKVAVAKICLKARARWNTKLPISTISTNKDLESLVTPMS